MLPLVKDLLKRVVLLGKDHYDKPYLMQMARKEFAKNANLTQEQDIRKAVAYGRWMVKEEQGRVRFKRYRDLKKRYYEDDDKIDQSSKKSGFNEEAELNKLNRGEE